jgi:predicted acetyltransferase
MLELVSPSIKYKSSYLSALKELCSVNEAPASHYLEWYWNFERALNRMEAISRGERLPVGWCPETFYWLVEDEHFIARISIRHVLIGDMAVWGGHIGYMVRPSERRKGYGEIMLGMFLPMLKTQGWEHVMITCDKENVGSYRIIEKHGGQMEDMIFVDDRIGWKRRYWIHL